MKKNLIKITIVLLAVVAFVSCKDTKSPEAVAEKYLTNIHNLEWEEAKKISMGESHEMIDFMKAMMDMAGEGELAEREDLNIESIDCEVKEETCQCKVVSNGEESIIDLKLVDGKWLVAFVSYKHAKFPEAVAEKYLTHIHNLEWEEAKKISTKESHEMIDFMKAMMGMAGEEALAAREDLNIESIDCELKEKTCQCKVVSNGEESIIDLKLVDGKWLVHQTKETGNDYEENDEFDWYEEDILENAEEIYEDAKDYLKDAVEEIVD